MKTETENKTTATAATKPAPIVKQETLPFKAVATLGKKGKVKFVMDNPLAGTKFGELRLVFVEPGKQDQWGNPVADPKAKSTQGFFNYHAFEALETASSITFEGKIEYLQMRSRQGDLIKFVSMEIENTLPFYEERKHRGLKVYLQNLELSGVFKQQAQKRLELNVFDS